MAARSISTSIAEPLLAGITVNHAGRIVYSTVTAGVYGEILRVIGVFFIFLEVQLGQQLAGLGYTVVHSPILQDAFGPNLRVELSRRGARARAAWASRAATARAAGAAGGRLRLARKSKVGELELGALCIGAEQLGLLRVQESESLRAGPAA